MSLRRGSLKSRKEILFQKRDGFNTGAVRIVVRIGFC